jgi:hypothetical protein
MGIPISVSAKSCIVDNDGITLSNMKKTILKGISRVLSTVFQTDSANLIHIQRNYSKKRFLIQNESIWIRSGFKEVRISENYSIARITTRKRILRRNLDEKLINILEEHFSTKRPGYPQENRIYPQWLRDALHGLNSCKTFDSTKKIPEGIFFINPCGRISGAIFSGPGIEDFIQAVEEVVE